MLYTKENVLTSAADYLGSNLSVSYICLLIKDKVILKYNQ